MRVRIVISVGARKLTKTNGQEALDSWQLRTEVYMARDEVFTPEQRDVYRFMRIGKTNEEIGLILGLSVSGVRYHVKNIIELLHVCNRVSAVAKNERRSAERQLKAA